MMPDEIYVSAHAYEDCKAVVASENPEFVTPVSYLKRIATKEEAKAAKIWVEGEKSRLQDMQVQISGQCEDYPHKAEIETILKLLRQSAGV